MPTRPMNKVEPMDRMYQGLGIDAVLSGARKVQTENRKTFKVVELIRGRYVIYPILSWTSRDIHGYLKEHDLPYHPLFDLGYTSIGDVHDTVPAGGDFDSRDGRKNAECGLHIPDSKDENDSFRLVGALKTSPRFHGCGIAASELLPMRSSTPPSSMLVARSRRCACALRMTSS